MGFITDEPAHPGPMAAEWEVGRGNIVLYFSLGRCDQLFLWGRECGAVSWKETTSMVRIVTLENVLFFIYCCRDSSSLVFFVVAPSSKKDASAHV